MRISLALRYEQTLSMFFTVLSVSLFLAVILLIAAPALIISNLVLVCISIASSLLVMRAFYLEYKQETFDLTSPTLFETGLLVFPSQRNRCAIFFAFNFSNMNLNKTLAQRALTILLKVLPSSTIIAIEWTSERQCYISFYIKLEKVSFLNRGSELLDNIHKSFNKILGTQSIRLLSGDELTTHFSMGIQGRFQKISVCGKNQIKIQTDTRNTKRAIAAITPKSFDRCQTLLQTLENVENYRLVLPIIKTDTTMQIAGSLILVSGDPNVNKSLQEMQSDFVSSKLVPASKSMRMFGDVLSRNQVNEESFESDYQATATTITNLVSIHWPADIGEEVDSGADQERSSDVMSSLFWRELLSKELVLNELPFQKDTVIFVDKLPVRVDVQSNDWLFFVISHTKQFQIRWLYRKIIKFLEKNETKEVIFLLSTPQDLKAFQEGQSNRSISSRIHVVANRQELVLLLKQKKGQFQQKRTRLAQVA